MPNHAVPVIRSTRSAEQLLALPHRVGGGRGPNAETPTQPAAGFWPDRHQVEFGIRLALNNLAVFGLFGILGLAALAAAPQLFGFDTVVIGSGSMEPSLQVADVVVLADPLDRRVDVGSIVNYHVDSNDGTQTSARETRIHRVIEIVPDGGYRTKGDANPTPDVATVDADSVVGIGIYLVPFIGLPRQWLATGQWTAISIAALAMLAMAFAGRDSFVDRPAIRIDEHLGTALVLRRSRQLRT